MASIGNCTCDVAASFDLGLNGVISANLRVNTNFMVTEGGIVLRGPTMGDFSLSAYTDAGKNYKCPGRAGTSFEWMQKISCDDCLKVYFIPNGKAKAYKEGDAPVTLVEAGCSYRTFSASASSGPSTPVFRFNHTDGYNLTYQGGPLAIGPENGKGPTTVGKLTTIVGGGELYLTSFSWEHTPPNIPVVNYSFIFVYDCK